MSKYLKEASKQYFDEQQLNSKQLNELEQMLSQATDKKEETTPPTLETQPNRRWFNRVLVSSAAMFLFALLLTMLYPTTHKDLSLVIAKEVAKNHIKLKPLEITSDDFAKVSSYFTELEFSPAPSDYFSKLGMRMLGGRYCSIQSVNAAQLRYQDNQGQPVTLYEVGYDPNKFGDMPMLENNEAPLVHFVKGLEIKLWVEKDLLMASVKP